MKIIEQKLIKVIFSDDPNKFEEKFNNAMRELAGKEVQVDLDPARQNGFLAYLQWNIRSKKPESIRDEYELEGKVYYCKDCPFFKLGKNKTCKSSGCSKNIISNAVDYTVPCDTFYKLLKEGKIKPNK